MSKTSKKICILGHFGHGKNLLNGQTVKTTNLSEGFKKYSNYEVIEIDTHNWIRKPISLLKKLKRAFIECEIIIMLPAHNGVKIFSPIFLYYKRKFNKKIFYSVVGGWLPQFLKNKKYLSNTLKLFDGIWVETFTMKNKLQKQGFSNVIVVPNFKEFEPMSEADLMHFDKKTLRLCTFSRVMKEKGIETAIDVIKKINAKLGYSAYSLDIYGQIDENSKEWFEEIQKKFPDYVSYKGYVDSKKSVEILQKYFALIFPTHFYTEGIPGTIIDAYASGTPVISSKWESFSDVIDEGKTGFGYKFDDKKEFEKILMKIEKNPKILLDMKVNCLKKAKEYIPKNVIKLIVEEINI